MRISAGYEELFYVTLEEIGKKISHLLLLRKMSVGEPKTSSFIC